MKKRIALLGATGSIGDSALSAVAHFPGRFEIVSMAAGSKLAFEELRYGRKPDAGRIRRLGKGGHMPDRRVLQACAAQRDMRLPGRVGHLVPPSFERPEVTEVADPIRGQRDEHRSRRRRRDRAW